MNLISKLVISKIRESVNQFTEGILSYIPKPFQNAATQQVEELKDELEEEVNESFNKPDEFSPNEYKEAFAGYLKTFRIDGQAGYDPVAFTNVIKPALFDLIMNNKKLSKVKLKFTVKYKKENPNTGQINMNFGHHHSHDNIIITDSTER